MPSNSEPSKPSKESTTEPPAAPFHLSPEQAARAEAGTRELMELQSQSAKPIDLTKAKPATAE